MPTLAQHLTLKTKIRIEVPAEDTSGWSHQIFDKIIGLMQFELSNFDSAHSIEHLNHLTRAHALLERFSTAMALHGPSKESFPGSERYPGPQGTLRKLIIRSPYDAAQILQEVLDQRIRFWFSLRGKAWRDSSEADFQRHIDAFLNHVQGEQEAGVADLELGEMPGTLEEAIRWAGKSDKVITRAPGYERGRYVTKLTSSGDAGAAAVPRSSRKRWLLDKVCSMV